MLCEMPDVDDKVGPKQLDHFALSFIYHSNAMEGNTLCLEDVKEVLNGKVCAGHSLNDHLGVIGIRDAWNYALECVNERKPLSQTSSAIFTVWSCLKILSEKENIEKSK